MYLMRFFPLAFTTLLSSIDGRGVGGEDVGYEGESLRPVSLEEEKRSVTTSDGREREFLFYRPPSSLTKSGPGADTLVLQYHGLNKPCSIFGGYTGLISYAETNGFYLATPCGMPGIGGQVSWNAGVCCSVGIDYKDSEFFDLMLENIKDSLPSDSRIEKIYLVGESNGAFMSQKLACEKSHIVSKVVSIIGNNVMYPGGPTSRIACDRAYEASDKRVSSLHFHGNKDIFVPYEGTYFPEHFQNIEDNARGWARRNSCDASQVAKETLSPTLTKITWPDCAKSGVDVELVFKEGWGHHWPRASDGWCATEESVRFLLGNNFNPPKSI